jgi:hypothetical protein
MSLPRHEKTARLPRNTLLIPRFEINFRFRRLRFNRRLKRGSAVSVAVSLRLTGMGCNH